MKLLYPKRSLLIKTQHKREFACITSETDVPLTIKH